MKPLPTIAAAIAGVKPAPTSSRSVTTRRPSGSSLEGLFIGGCRLKKLILATLAALTALIPACERSSSFKGLVKIGLVAPFSGRDYARGYNVLYGVKLALREWNQRGGVGGYRVELVAQDDHDEAEAGLLQAAKMILDPDVAGVIGHPSGASALAALEQYRRAGMPVIFTEATSEQLDARGNTGILRLNAGDRVLAMQILEFARRRLAAKTVAVVSGEDLEGTAQAKALVAAGTETSLPVVLERKVNRDDLDFAEVIRDLRAVDAGTVVFFGSFAQGGELLSQMRAAGLQTPFIAGPTAATPDFAKIAGNAVIGAYYTSLAPAPEDLAQGLQFIENYRAVGYGREPWASAVLAYDATNILLKAIEQSMAAGKGSARESVAAALPQALALSKAMAGATPGGLDSLADSVWVYRVSDLRFPGERQY